MLALRRCMRPFTSNFQAYCRSCATIGHDVSAPSRLRRRAQPGTLNSSIYATFADADAGR
jgi:hypothetical protein